MQHQTYSWKQRAGQEIFAQSWHADAPAKAIFVIIHGQSDHSGRFTTMAEWMTQKGYAVYAADLIGHGKSGGKRGHMLHFEEYLETVEALIDKAKSAHPDLPVFLYGQSMGGNVVINYAFTNKQGIRACIASSPWVRLAFEPPAWKVLLGKWMRSIYPALAQPTGLNAAHLSHDAQIVQAYQQDPLVHGKITASAFFETLQAGIHIPDKASSLQVPMLIMHGSADQLTSSVASKAFADLRPDLITHILFTDWFHELHNEPEKDKVFNTIEQFIQQNL